MKFAAFLTLFMSMSAFAYTVTSGVQLCGKKATLYSLYEGSHPSLHNIPVWKDNRRISTQSYLKKAMDHIERDLPTLAKLMRPRIKIVQDHLNITLLGDYPQFKSSTDVVFLEPGCVYRSMTFWSDGSYEIMTVDQTIFKKMSPLNQAAFIIQEAFWKIDRDANEETSYDRDRYIVAKIFSDLPLTVKLDLKNMTQEEKAQATMHLCTKAVKLFPAQLEVLIKTVDLCKKGRETGLLENYQRITDLIRETVEDCQRECHDERYVQICLETGDLLNKRNACD